MDKEILQAIANLEKAFIASRDSALPIATQLKEHTDENKKDFKRIEDKIDPILEIINKAKNTGQVSNWIFTWLIKTVIGVGVLISAIYAIKNWIMK